MVVIEAVDERSPAARLGLQKGDRLVSLNRQEINDVLDYEFYANDSGLRIEYLRGDERRAVSLWHRADEPLGLRFSTYLMDEKRRCRNGCIFCFIDQNPRGLRESLYFKDDDERLSFLHGNYVTLTNLAPAQIERIVKMRISPINVSVHTTDPELRVRMMRNKDAGRVLGYLDTLAAGGISAQRPARALPYGQRRRRPRPLARRPAQARHACQRRLRAGGPDRAPRQSDAADAVRPGERLRRARPARREGARILRKIRRAHDLRRRRVSSPPAGRCRRVLLGASPVGKRRRDAALPHRRVRRRAGGDGCGRARGRLSPASPARRPTTTSARSSRRRRKGTPGWWGRGEDPQRLLRPVDHRRRTARRRDIIAQLRARGHHGRLILPSCMLRAEGDLVLDDTTLPQLSEALGAAVTVAGPTGEELARGRCSADE